jgi:hypothetical protein
MKTQTSPSMVKKKKFSALVEQEKKAIRSYRLVQIRGSQPKPDSRQWVRQLRESLFDKRGR